VCWKVVGAIEACVHFNFVCCVARVGLREVARVGESCEFHVEFLLLSFVWMTIRMAQNLNEMTKTSPMTC
jgi:hypothetical protein